MRDGQLVQAIQTMNDPSPQTEKQLCDKLDDIYKSYPFLNNRAKEYGLAPIHAAIKYTNTAAIKWLLNKGGKLNLYLLAHDQKGSSNEHKTALCYAVQYADSKKYSENFDQKNQAQQLDKKNDADAKDQKESLETMKRRQCLKLLLDHREPLSISSIFNNRKTENLKQAVINACRSNNLYFLDYFFTEYQKSYSPKEIRAFFNIKEELENAVKNNHLPIVEYLLDITKKLPVPNLPCRSDWLQTAIKNCQPDLVRVLLVNIEHWYPKINHDGYVYGFTYWYGNVHTGPDDDKPSHDQNYLFNRKNSLELLFLAIETYQLSHYKEAAAKTIETLQAFSGIFHTIVNAAVYNNKIALAPKGTLIIPYSYGSKQNFIELAIQAKYHEVVKLLTSAEVYDRTCQNNQEHLIGEILKSILNYYPFPTIKNMLFIAAKANIFKPGNYFLSQSLNPDFCINPRGQAFLTAYTEYYRNSANAIIIMENLKKSNEEDYTDLIQLFKEIQKAADHAKAQAVAQEQQAAAALAEKQKAEALAIETKKQNALALQNQFNKLKQDIQDEAKNSLSTALMTTSAITIPEPTAPMKPPAVAAPAPSALMMSSAVTIPEPSAPPQEARTLPAASAPSDTSLVITPSLATAPNTLAANIKSPAATSMPQQLSSGNPVNDNMTAGLVSLENISKPNTAPSMFTLFANAPIDQKPNALQLNFDAKKILAGKIDAYKAALFQTKDANSILYENDNTLRFAMMAGMLTKLKGYKDHPTLGSKVVEILDEFERISQLKVNAKFQLSS